ncbi:MAG: outer membrane beta-barrel protein [Cytophagales bacterium]|nr:PorT family protein [Bernardetiaceae bacterium]MDW8209868.1 outer membrane beta-barrel protein [Cytophagales bacterium]
MQNNEKTFEDIFKEAFEKAELSPSDRVWKNIERELARKPRLLSMPFLKKLGVAAVIALFVLSASYLVYHFPTTETTQQVVNQPFKSSTFSEAPSPTSSKNQSHTADNQTDFKTNHSKTGKSVASHSSPNSSEPIGLGSNFIIISGSKQSTSNHNKKLETPITLLPLPPLQPLPLALANKHILQPIVTQSARENNQEAPLTFIERPRAWIGVLMTGSKFNPGFSHVTTLQPTPLMKGQYAQASVIHNDLTDSLLNVRSISAQLEGGYFLGRKVALRSGLIFTSNAYQINSSAELYLPQFLQGMTTKPNNIQVRSQLLSVPLQMTYVAGSKWGYRFSAGLLGDFTLAHHISSIGIEGLEYDFGTYKPFNLSATAGIGIFYYLTPQLGIYLEGNYRRGLTSVYQTPHLRSHPEWLGLSSGLLYKF